MEKKRTITNPGIIIAMEPRLKAARGSNCFFAILRGPVVGIFETFEQVKKANGHVKGSVYIKFTSRDLATKCYNAALQLPRFTATEAQETIYISSQNYDVTQERDTYAAVAIHYGKPDTRNICLQADTRSLDLDILIFQRAVQLIRKNQPARTRIFTDSYRVAYGINYGLWKWPKHDICVAPNVVGQEIENFVKTQGIALDWLEHQNLARNAAIACCRNQFEEKIPSFCSKNNKEPF